MLKVLKVQTCLRSRTCICTYLWVDLSLVCAEVAYSSVYCCSIVCCSVCTVIVYLGLCCFLQSPSHLLEITPAVEDGDTVLTVEDLGSSGSGSARIVVVSGCAMINLRTYVCVYIDPVVKGLSCCKGPLVITLGL